MHGPEGYKLTGPTSLSAVLETYRINFLTFMRRKFWNRKRKCPSSSFQLD